jgi:lysophospholipase
VQLYPTPDNPIPGPEPVLMSVTAKDGVPLRVARWVPEGPCQGTVCILQGRAEFIEKYFETVGDLLVRGFAVVAFDWRGQGHSGRQVRNARKGHVRRFSDYRRDLAAIRDQVLIPHMPQPHFALAHSMGGAIALQAAAEGALPFRRLVTTTPMIALCIINNLRTASVVARVLHMLGFGRAFIPGGGETSISKKPYAGNRLTSDPVRYARNAAAAAAVGDGAIGDPTVAWIHSAFRFMDAFRDPRFGLKVRLPTLIVAAGADPVCATPVTERLAARLKAGHAIVLRGAKHEILMERDAIREQFWAAFDAFIPGSDGAVMREGPAEAAAPRDIPAPQAAAPVAALPAPAVEEPRVGDADAAPEPVLALAASGPAAEELDRGRVDAAVAGGDDRPALGR